MAAKAVKESDDRGTSKEDDQPPMTPMAADGRENRSNRSLSAAIGVIGG
jgi:hypothetical protein